MLIRILLAANILVFAIALSQRIHRPPSEAPETPQVRLADADYEPTAEQIEDRNQGVGWVFGRMVGAAHAPGSPSHSPFGKSTRAK